MYHLTKKFSSNYCLRDEIFLELLKNNYSNEVILKYKNTLIELVRQKNTEKINLGFSLRSMLAAVTVIAYKHNIRIIPRVFGSGSFSLNINSLELDLIKLLILSANSARERTVYINIFIKSGGLIINIRYKKLALPNMNDKANLTYSIKLKKCSNGKVNSFEDYIINRLSTVNIAFTCLLNQ